VYSTALVGSGRDVSPLGTKFPRAKAWRAQFGLVICRWLFVICQLSFVMRRAGARAGGGTVWWCARTAGLGAQYLVPTTRY